MNESNEAAVAQLLQSLPRLGANDEFCFSCHSGRACFNACCQDLTLPLLPYDVLRLATALSMPSGRLLEKHCLVGKDPQTGFPLVALAMGPDPDRTCPFVGPQGCKVYSDRPAPCRTYPLGRGARLLADGQIQEEFVVVEDSVCQGFDGQQTWTAANWLADQELAEYNRLADSHLRLLHTLNQRQLVVGPYKYPMTVLALFQQDVFAKYIAKKDLLARHRIPEEKRQRIMENPTERLVFAYEWIVGHLTLGGGSCQSA